MYEECDCADCCGSRVGPQGFFGVQGSPTTIGTQGPIGTQGLISIGAQGGEGFQGLVTNGAQGFLGVQGAPDALPPSTGQTGSPGYQGPDIDQGPQGFMGTIGAQGVNGSNENTGPRGFQGPFVNGVEGPQGFQGYKTPGPQGPTGPSGSVFQSAMITELNEVTYTVTSTLVMLPTFVTPAAYVRAELHFRFDTGSINFEILDTVSLTSIGPTIRVTANSSQAQPLVITRNVPSGSYAIAFFSGSGVNELTLFNYSVVRIFQ